MMTNQEAANELQYAIDLIKQDGKDWLDERDIPILEMAISALKAQEAKHSTESSLTHKALDTISRQAAIDAIDSSALNLYDPEENWMMQDRIRALPSAEPEHMHTVMLKIKEKYEKAMNTPCINNPIAWALYQTWKEYDR